MRGLIKHGIISGFLGLVATILSLSVSSTSVRFGGYVAHTRGFPLWYVNTYTSDLLGGGTFFNAWGMWQDFAFWLALSFIFVTAIQLSGFARNPFRSVN